MFPHDSDEVRRRCGYHPGAIDLPTLLGATRFSRLLVVGTTVRDVVELVDSTRVTAESVDLPAGLYWFSGLVAPVVMAVSAGGPSADGTTMAVDQLDNEDEPLANAFAWAEYLWESANEVPAPRFPVNADVMTLGEGQESVVRRRRFVAGSWSYELRIGGRTQHVHENALDDIPESGEPTEWVCAEPSSIERFGATLTRGKLETALTDTVFSFRATRTVFRPYQFKPVLRLLQTGATRVLIADEVGLGKTIEAGLIWTELEARRAADRVLIITPSSLVTKWQEEMAERFGFSLVELDNPGLDRFLTQHLQGQVPRRVAYVTSLERLRMWTGLESLIDVPPQFDLIVVDEAHAMRNPDTKSHALGEQINDWADSRVFLTATPVNLGNSDLASILELLAPEDFDDPHVLELRLQPNAVLHQLEALLLQRGATARDRLDVLKKLQNMKFGPALMSRPGFGLLEQVVARQPLTPADVVEARQHLAELNVLSSVITRTRKVEIDEHKALREPRMIEVQWTDDEARFYSEYVTWCVRRSAAVNMPLHFAMQMPLRLASACLPGARNAVLGAAGDWKPVDEDTGDGPEIPDGPAPHGDLILAASNLQPGVDSKYDRLLPIILELIEQDKQVLLFTFSRPTLAYLRERLSAHARVTVLHGGVARADRRRVMAEFRAGKFDILLANRVASEGLDFEFCSAVINYDLPWNPMEVEQRIGRIDRIGQREQKILVINFYNEATIDEKILTRVLERIGVFERAIGALEPIIQSQLPALQDAVFDFTLSPAQREAKTDQILTAIEGKRVEAERLVDATSELLVSNSVDVAGLEGDLVRGGRYVGQMELAHLLHDWATTAKAPGIVALDDSKVRLHGNAAMSEQLLDVARRGVRMRSELNELAEALRDEIDLTLLLDQEAARISGGDLLTATHPLVLAAVAVPGHRQARFANIRVRDVEGVAPEGRFVVILALASGSGERATREIWGAAVDANGRVAAEAVPDALLAALARGGFQTAEAPLDPADLVDLVDVATDSLYQRHAAEQERRRREADALLESRRISLREQLERRLDAVDRRMATASARGRGGQQMFEGQRRRAVERHKDAVRSLDQERQQTLTMSWLAACCLEIVR